MPALDDDVNESLDLLPDMAAEGAVKPTLDELRQHTAQAKRTPCWIYLLIIIGVVIFLSLTIWVIIFVFTHKWWLLRRTIRLIASRVWPPNSDVVYEDHQEVVGAALPSTESGHPEPPSSPLPPPRNSSYTVAVPQPSSRRSRSQPPSLPSAFARARLQLLHH